MLVGLPPYYDAVDTQKMFDSILNDPLKLPPNISAEASDLLQRLLKKQPHVRPSIKDVKAHPWFKGTKPKKPPIVPSIFESYFEKQGDLRIQTTQQRRQSYYYESTV